MRISFDSAALRESEDATRWYRAHGGANPAREFTRELRRVVNLACCRVAFLECFKLGFERAVLLGQHGLYRTW